MSSRTKSYVVGVSGRSGSGKSTLVQALMQHFGPDHISLHTMDNYYLPSNQQVVDDKQFRNFDLPSSFDRPRFFQDLLALMEGHDVSLHEYRFTDESPSDHILTLKAAPIILVEGLFVYNYEEVREQLHYKIMMDVSYNQCYQRRLRRDLHERNYSEDQTYYRYNAHVEPSYQAYIAPYLHLCDLIIKNEESYIAGLQEAINHLDKVVQEISKS